MKGLRADTVLDEDDVPGQGHSMAVVGYDDSRKAFLVQSSWGQQWAAKGRGWFGYDYWKRNSGPGYVIE
jgi:C1A family cysteine protease